MISYYDTKRLGHGYDTINIFEALDLRSPDLSSCMAEVLCLVPQKEASEDLMARGAQAVHPHDYKSNWERILYPYSPSNNRTFE